MSSQEVSVSSTVATGELSGSTGAVATAASAFSNYVDSVTEEDEAVKAFGKNPHPYTAPSRPKDDDEEERIPLDLFWVEETQKVYQKLVLSYPAVMGKSVSRKERKSKGLVAPHLAYSEITYQSLGTVLAKIRQYHGGLQDGGGVFYDLGSGTGKAVCAAAILHTFDKCVGIEVLQTLHEVAIELLDTFDRTVKPTLGDSPPEVQFVLGDILEMEWPDATVVFANCTCYSQTLMANIIQRCSPLREGTFFISVSKRLKSDAWKVLDSQLLEMNWGTATVFIHQKITGAPAVDSDDSVGEDESDET